MIRLLDVILSMAALVFLSPILFFCCLILKITGEHEIFFKQQRIGLNGTCFSLLKFATMKKNSPNEGTRSLTVKNDPRILPVGKFLRKAKINEIPQLFNVVRGDMSLIGPRPQSIESFNLFPHKMKKKIVSVRPGISGIGSIVFRNEEELLKGTDSTSFYGNQIMPYKGKIELWFVENKCLKLWIKLILLTIWVVCLPSSKLVWRMFDDLPKPNETLSISLGLKQSD